MSFHPTPKHTLFLWHLLWTGEEPKISETKPKLDTKERKVLEEAGLIQTEKRGRSSHVILTDKGWSWLGGHMEAEISKRSNVAAFVLQALLARLKTYINVHDLSLADLMITPEQIPVSSVESVTFDQIASAYAKASGGEWQVRVRLADLRPLFPNVPREILDTRLLEEQKKGNLVLYPIDDPLDRRPEDHEAAIDIMGYKRHILYMKG